MANPYLSEMRKQANRGMWNKPTVRAFQHWAKRKGYYPSNYLIDGVEGHGTRVAIQKWLKADGTYSGLLDGGIGKMTVDAMRRTLDKRVDWSFTVTLPNGTVISDGSGKLPVLTYFPSTRYVLKLQAYLEKQN